MKMSSLEIAELTGKRHANVLRDIRSMLDQMNPDSDLSYQENQGVTSVDCPQTKRITEFLLDRYHTEILITGYDVKRDIEVMSEGLEEDVSKFAHTYKDSQNRNQNMYLLDRYHTEILITGYDVKRRAAVIKRWFDPISLICKGLEGSRLKRGPLKQEGVTNRKSTPCLMSSKQH